MARPDRRPAMLAASGLFALALLAVPGAPLAQSVGSVGAVNPAASGTPPGGGTRTLTIGNSVVRNERLKTSASGTLNLLFSDRSSFNLGPNTDLTLNEYVYNPSSGTGSMKASVGSGILRFVGGQISHTEGATVTTPVGTIGIRGNMAIVGFDAGCGWRITSLGQGTVAVSNRVSQSVIARPGYTVCVASANQPIGDPVRADPAAIEQAFAATLSGPGQRGGANRLPTDIQAGRFGIGTDRIPATGSTLDYLSVFSVQGGIGRNSQQGRSPRFIVQPTVPATVVQTTTPPVTTTQTTGNTNTGGGRLVAGGGNGNTGGGNTGGTP